jgi:small-conductance mechanosensitive channel
MENIDISFLNLIKSWAIVHLPRIIIILLGMWLAMKSANFVSRRIRILAEDDDPTRESDREKRANTLSQILKTASKVLIITIGSIMLIKEAGIDIGPLLAGAGIIGLAIGFGSQALVKDIVTGFFILLEDQLRVGDVIRAGDHAGLVEKITLRTISLRDSEGALHVVPNGDAGAIVNLTYGWSRAVVNIGIAYKENVDRAIEVIRDEATKMAEEPEWKEIITEPPSILGVDSLGDSSVNIVCWIKTRPLSQWSVSREFRRRMKNRFDAEGIEIPFPHRTIVFNQEALDTIRELRNLPDKSENQKPG